MSDLRKLNFSRATVIEVHPDRVVVGTESYSGINPGETFAIGWDQLGGGNRTLGFSRDAWSYELQGNVLILRRITADLLRFDVPPPCVQLYFIVMHADESR